MMIEDAELRNIFKIASEEHLQNLESGLMHLETHPNDRAILEELLREAHTLKGDARMLGVSEVETLIHQLEEILAAAGRGETVLAAQNCDRLYQGLDAIRQLVQEAVTGQPAGVNVFYVLANLMGAAASAYGEQQIAASVQIEPPELDALFPDILAKPPKQFDEVDALFPETLSEPPKQFDEVDALFPEMAEAAKISHLSVAQPVVPAPLPSAAVGEPAGASNYQIETIRVEPQKLDILIAQAGELTVTKNRIAHHLVDIEEIVALWDEWSRDAFVNRGVLQDGSHLHNSATKQVQFHHRTQERLERLGVLINQLKTTAQEDSARLEIVADELESGIQTLRLLPLSTIFNLFPRMVRDLAKQQSKEVNLAIEGGETTADKRILEEMKDPLMHILRNAIDHGIETPSERRQMGKPSAATIRLRGYQTASSIGIEIIDDGLGLNIESIKRTALRRGICSEAKLAAMTTDQIQSLIFAPGFSTRTAVTELSGRGVGLDVVRANAERLKGTIQVESTPGAGCTFRLQLDTTITTTPVLILGVNNISYALPVEFVQTSLAVSKSEIFAIEGNHTIILDGQPVSVTPLADLLEFCLLYTSPSPRDS